MRYRRSHAVRQRLAGRVRRPYRVRQRVLLGLLVVTMAGWGGWALIRNEGQPNGLSRLLGRSEPPPRPVDARIKRVVAEAEQYRTMDFAIAQALTNLQVAPGRVKETQSWQPGRDGLWHPTRRTVRVSAFYSFTRCNLEVTRAITAAGGRISSAVEHSLTRELTLRVGIGDLLTHELTLRRDPDVPRRTGQMAIIIDDLGEVGGDVTTQFVQIKQPLTFALIPWQREARHLATEAILRKHEVIVHLPMEPKEYPRLNPGWRAIFVKQSDAQIRRVIQDALIALPAARGVNNHMGSRATENAQVMQILLEEVKRSGKYFIDSRTTPLSVGYPLARRLGIRSAASWGFLDEIDDQERIADALDLASHTALEQGPLIVIGHARPNTLTVLLQMLDRLELRGIQFVPASALAR
ncbi:MAG: divergent polysaccharide deacetylase family protein [Candidatus Latescibacteria bacterium]|nr:divergent polysaccharide deacetylase family protein [Candidatus Latescibacterota bacterium]